MIIETHQSLSQMQVYKVTIVEIQMVNVQSGAIQRIKTPDGSIVNPKRSIQIPLLEKELVTHIPVQLTAKVIGAIILTAQLNVVEETKCSPLRSRN